MEIFRNINLGQMLNCLQSFAPVVSQIHRNCPTSNDVEKRLLKRCKRWVISGYSSCIQHKVCYLTIQLINRKDLLHIFQSWFIIFKKTNICLVLSQMQKKNDMNPSLTMPINKTNNFPRYALGTQLHAFLVSLMIGVPK